MGYGNGTKTRHANGAAYRINADGTQGPRVPGTLRNDMVAHVWAQNSQTFGKSGNGNFYFNGPALYSYGSHYLVGYILPDGCALLNDDSSSVSTNRQRSDASGAVRHRTRYYVPGLTELTRALESLTYHAKRNEPAPANVREQFRRHVESNPLHFDGAPQLTAAGIKLLMLAGVKAPSVRLAKIVADHIRKRDKETAGKKAKAKKEALSDARFYSTRPPAMAWELRPTRALGDTRDIDSQIADAYKAHKAAKAAKFEKQARGVWLYLKELRAVKAHQEERKRIAYGNAHKRNRINYARQAWGEIQAFKFRDSYRARESARMLLACLPLPFVKPETVKTWQAESARAIAWADEFDRVRARRDAQKNVRHNLAQLQRALADVGGHRTTSRWYMASSISGPAYKLADALRGVSPATSAEFYALAQSVDAWSDQEQERERMAREKAEREKAAREFAQLADLRGAWLRGEKMKSSIAWRARELRDETGGALLRATGVERDATGAITGGTLETSQGATVPLTHAIRAFRFLKVVRARGQGWQKNGHAIRVGHFTVDSIDVDGNFRAGCHSINWAETERLAIALGVFDVTPDSAALEKTH